uniref:Regulatory protein E2 n=1 Tax=Human papillomavirus 58 TaxID=10598 RepID=F8S5G3_HPV58|nr:early protein E2 [human papillomavirus 58]
MEEMSARLSAVQDKILDIYEADKNDLTSQIEHWKLIRMECAIMYTARQMGISHLCHQVVPSLVASKTKAFQVIELQMALETLNASPYKTDEWTLQQTSLEVWLSEPQKCFKKKGITVTVQYDNDKANTMDYTNWSEIYIIEETTCTLVAGKVDYVGLYYIHGNEKTYFKYFKEDAKKYSKTQLWEVHVGSRVIVCPTSIPSDQISTTETADPKTTEATNNESTQGTKRRRLDLPDSRDNTQYSTKYTDCAVDSRPRGGGLHSTTNCTYKGRNVCSSKVAPILHLKGDPNSLKCLRYRLKPFKDLYCNMSSTWHWTSDDKGDKVGIVTVTYTTETQRQMFLNTVKIPPTVQISTGVMSL